MSTSAQIAADTCGRCGMTKPSLSRKLAAIRTQILAIDKTGNVPVKDKQNGGLKDGYDVLTAEHVVGIIGLELAKANIAIYSNVKTEMITKTTAKARIEALVEDGDSLETKAISIEGAWDDDIDPSAAPSKAITAANKQLLMMLIQVSGKEAPPRPRGSRPTPAPGAQQQQRPAATPGDQPTKPTTLRGVFIEIREDETRGGKPMLRVKFSPRPGQSQDLACFDPKLFEAIHNSQLARDVVTLTLDWNGDYCNIAAVKVEAPAPKR